MYRTQVECVCVLHFLIYWLLCTCACFISSSSHNVNNNTLCHTCNNRLKQLWLYPKTIFVKINFNINHNSWFSILVTTFAMMEKSKTMKFFMHVIIENCMGWLLLQMWIGCRHWVMNLHEHVCMGHILFVYWLLTFPWYVCRWLLCTRSTYCKWGGYVAASFMTK